MLALELPHYKQYTIFNMKEKITLNYPRSADTGCFSWGLKHQFETAIVNEPSVFEPLKFYCICMICFKHIDRRELAVIM